MKVLAVHPGETDSHEARVSAPAAPRSPLPQAPERACADFGSAQQVMELVDRARQALLQACHASNAAERFMLAHLAALRAAAAVLASRRGLRSRSRCASVWDLLPAAAPELGEPAAFFAGTARQRQLIERGGTVPVRTADDLLREAENFVDLVRIQVGLPIEPSVTNWQGALIR